MIRESVQTDNAPKAIGPYEQAIKANGFIYTAGQIPIEAKTGTFVEGGITARPDRYWRISRPSWKQGDQPSTASSKPLCF